MLKSLNQRAVARILTPHTLDLSTETSSSPTSWSTEKRNFNEAASSQVIVSTDRYS